MLISTILAPAHPSISRLHNLSSHQPTSTPTFPHSLPGQTLVRPSTALHPIPPSCPFKWILNVLYTVACIKSFCPFQYAHAHRHNLNNWHLSTYNWTSSPTSRFRERGHESQPSMGYLNLAFVIGRRCATEPCVVEQANGTLDPHSSTLYSVDD